MFNSDVQFDLVQDACHARVANSLPVLLKHIAQTSQLALAHGSSEKAVVESIELPEKVFNMIHRSLLT